MAGVRKYLHNCESYRGVSETGRYYPKLERVMEKSLQTLNRQKKIAVWSEPIAACCNGGINVRAWCEGDGIRTALL